jgi:hypothetical protein
MRVSLISEVHHVNNYRKPLGLLAAFGLMATLLAGCAGPLQVNGSSGQATNAVQITIGSPASRSGLISVTTAQAQSDTYEVLLYNAAHLYRTILNTNSGTLTNITPGTYAVLVLAGKSNGTKINGQNATLLLGTGDIPYTPGHTIAGAPDGYTGTGVTIAATGITNVSLNLENVIFSVSSTALGSNPYSIGINSVFSVTFSYDLFLNQFQSTLDSGSTPAGHIWNEGPIGYCNLGSVNFFSTSGAALGGSPTYSLQSPDNHTLNYTGNFTAGATSGTSVIALDAGGVNNAVSAQIGRLTFVNVVGFLSTGATGGTYYSQLTPAPQSGTATDWYLPSPSLATAYASVGVAGAATVNFSAPGAGMTIGWGAGR